MKHLPIIGIQTITHKYQRYDTAGDYQRWGIKKLGHVIHWDFLISKMKPDYEFLVLMHELTEWYLTQKRGISEPSITKFDTKTVFKLDPKNADDPGRSKFSPYHDEHMFSERIEKILAKELGINWIEYQKSFDNLEYKKESL